jgi:hypothetical protein
MLVAALGMLAKHFEHSAKQVEPTIAEHHGRIVKLMGDGALVESVDATECAVAIQKGIAERQEEVREDQRICLSDRHQHRRHHHRGGGVASCRTLAFVPLPGKSGDTGRIPGRISLPPQPGTARELLQAG